MEARRYNRGPAVRVSKSTSTLPGLILIAVGALILLAGVILLASFGIPRDVSQPKQFAGPIVLTMGGIVGISGVFYALYLNKKARKIQEQKALAKGKEKPKSTTPLPAGRR